MSDEDSDLLFQHVSSCESCQSELADLPQQEDSLIRDLRQATPDDHYLTEAGCSLALARALAAPLDATAVEDISGQLPEDRQLGEYELLESLGRGGMGTVYLARHTRLDRQVAVKVLPRHRLEDPRALQRFEREMRAIGKLDHPEIVKAYDAREIDDVPVIVMEYVDGLDAREIVLRLGPLATADACEIIRRMAGALQYVHEHGLIHRDIKPSNVMLSRSGDVKLLDLGLARLQLGDPDEPEFTGTGQALGTADYVAPEQVTDSRAVDIRADIYGLGCTLFMLLSGRAPFADEEHAGAFMKMTAHVSKPAPDLRNLVPGLPNSLCSLVNRMLAKSPADRPATPNLVMEALQPHCRGAQLESLMERALASPAASNLQTFTRPSASGHELPRPWWQRQTSVVLTLILMLAAGAAGFAAGIIITIEHPDGSQTSVKVPDRSQVEVSAEGNVKVRLPSATNESTAASGLGAGSEWDVATMGGGSSATATERSEMPTDMYGMENDPRVPPAETTQQNQSKLHLKMIMLAMHQYHEKHQQLPPAVITREGLPLYSWRVELLPFLGEQQLYEQFHLDEPWDSPHNRQLLSRMPDVYRAPMDAPDSQSAAYFAIVGPAAAIDETRSNAFKDILDGTSNTIAIVEARQNVPWTSPGDIRLEPDQQRIDAEAGVNSMAAVKMPKFQSIWVAGFYAGFLDGSVRLIDKSRPTNTIIPLFTRAGLEPVGTRDESDPGLPPEIRSESAVRNR